MDKTIAESRQVLLKLAEFFRRNGYLRVPSAARRKKDRREYKKGYEMRFVANTESELREIQSFLRRAGVKIGRPFSKHHQIVQPIYGKKPVEELCDMLGIR